MCVVVVIKTIANKCVKKVMIETKIRISQQVLTMTTILLLSVH